MQIKIKDLEKQLGQKIKNNFKVVGLDIATRTGVCELTTDSKNVKFRWTFLEFDSSNEKDLYQNMISAFGQVINDQKFAVIEDTFIGMNRAGGIKLTRFGAFAIVECFKKKIDWELIKAVSARAKFKIDTRKFGRGKSKEAVAFWLKENLGLQLDDHDISDSIILALLGIIEGMDFKPKTKKKKRKSKNVPKSKK